MRGSGRAWGGVQVQASASARACGRSLRVLLFKGGPVREVQACARVWAGFGWGAGAGLALYHTAWFPWVCGLRSYFPLHLLVPVDVPCQCRVAKAGQGEHGG